MKKYKVIAVLTDSPEVIEEKINTAVDDGYRPDGDLQVTPWPVQSKLGGPSVAMLFVQRMVLVYNTNNLEICK
jgi:hypothetical protein